VAISPSQWSRVLACEQPTLIVAGRSLRLRRGCTAGDWVAALEDGRAEAVLPDLLCPEGVDAWVDLFFGNEYLVPIKLHHDMALALFEACSGFPLNQALRLFSAIVHDWHRFNGWATSKGVSPLSLSLSGLLDMFFFYCIQHADEKQQYRFETDLSLPLPGTSLEDPPAGWDEASTAMAALAAHQRGKK
jgi:hypothetical protein